jgi:hypothetical protein
VEHSRKMSICPACGFMLLPQQISAHGKICPGGAMLVGRQGKSDNAAPPVVVTSLSQSDEDDDPDDVISHLGYADARDASRYWGHYFRDHGSYGSYPVHDDFDDESEP